jgi:hypothetical protein
MSEGRLRRDTRPVAQRPAGRRWVAYWCGRILQVLGLALMVEVLLLFTSPAGMELLLYWSMMAAVVFYTGWACITWAKR